jgi:hypothetical protein
MKSAIRRLRNKSNQRIAQWQPVEFPGLTHLESRPFLINTAASSPVYSASRTTRNRFQRFPIPPIVLAQGESPRIFSKPRQSSLPVRRKTTPSRE